MLQVGSYWCPGLHACGNETKTSLDVNVKYETFFKLKMNEKSQKPLKIPVFQRRYCWSGEVLSLWVKEAMFGRAPGLDYGVGHSVGLVVIADCPQHRLLIDGQQRTITAMLGLIVLRDVFGRSSFEFSWEVCPLTVARLDAEVFASLWEGNSVSFNDGTLAQSYHLIRRLVSRKKKTLSVVRMAHNLLKRCHFKVFTAEEKLGPQLFQWIQEKSVANCVGDPTLKQAWNSHPGQHLAQADLIRNHVLAFFVAGGQAEQVFDLLWLPLEEKCVDVAGLSSHMCIRLKCDERDLVKVYLATINTVVGDAEGQQLRDLVRVWIKTTLL